MFRIRKEQKLAFRQAALRDFEDRVMAHLQRCLADWVATMGERSVRQVIRLGIDRATSFGITNERDVCRFIDLMIVLGSDFDSRLSWARKILESAEDVDTALGRLHMRAMENEWVPRTTESR